jgi:hypothetical protein
VPLWEILAQGLPIYAASPNISQQSQLTRDSLVIDLFPEVKLRTLISSILVWISHGFSKSSTSISRIFGALIHSQQSTLRLQVVASLFYMNLRYPPLQSILWNFSTSDVRSINNNKKKNDANSISNSESDAVGGIIFRQFMISLLKDLNDFAEFLKLIAAYLTKFIINEDEFILRNRKSSSKDSNLSKKNTALVKLEGKLTKMQCSELKHIKAHSQHLYGVLTSTSSSSDSNSDNQADSTNISTKSYPFPVLSGSYSVWQEMFSHITSSSLMTLGIGRMSRSSLIEALILSKIYGIHHCHRYYCDALFTKLSNLQICELLELCLSLDSTSLSIQQDYTKITNHQNLEEPNKLSPVAIDMMSGIKTRLCYTSANLDNFLSLKCIEYMINNMDSVSKQLNSNKALDIIDYLHIILFKLFFSSSN